MGTGTELDNPHGMMVGTGAGPDHPHSTMAKTDAEPDQDLVRGRALMQT